MKPFTKAIKITIPSLALLLLTAGFTFAQNTITGTVKDSKGQPLAGASVLVRGISKGASADKSGV